MKNIGLYIHIPFCNGKCPYCDFYSLKNNNDNINQYTEYLLKAINSYKGKNFIADTIYFGGGTPSLLGTERIVKILDSIKNSFGDFSMETTLEVNPESAYLLDFEKLKSFGVSRISIGLQSSNEKELAILGRKHSVKDVINTINSIRASGIDNISLDLMVGISNQTEQSLTESILFCSEMGVKHISAYLLKIEEGTLYYKNKNQLVLPNEDTVCDFYELMCEKLKSLNYKQYEISNFCFDGYESKHNLKYWNCMEYLGLGSSAHSFIDGKRFFYSRSLKDFYNNKTTGDGTGGDEEEYISMQLRLSSGISYDRFKDYFGYNIPERYISNAKKLIKTGLLTVDNEGIRLNTRGFLCSNSIIVNIIS